MIAFTKILRLQEKFANQKIRRLAKRLDPPTTQTEFFTSQLSVEADKLFITDLRAFNIKSARRKKVARSKNRNLAKTLDSTSTQADFFALAKIGFKQVIFNQANQCLIVSLRLAKT